MSYSHCEERKNDTEGDLEKKGGVSSLLLLAIGMLVTPVQARAEEVETPIAPGETFHLPPQRPTEVEIGLYLNDPLLEPLKSDLG